MRIVRLARTVGPRDRDGFPVADPTAWHKHLTLGRRALLAAGACAAGLGAVSLSLRAQPVARARLPTVGVLWHAGSQVEEGRYFAARLAALLEGFRTAGYVEGQNIQFEHRYPNKLEHFEAYAAELVARKPEVLIAVTLAPAQALQRTGTTIPIVFLIVPDAVAGGLVQSLAHPGGNITGLSNVSTELSAKRLQMFKEAIPSLARVALLTDPGDRGVSERAVSEMRAVAAGLRLEIQLFEARTAADFEAAFQRIGRARIEGLVTAPGPLFFVGRRRLAELAMEYRLPSIHVNGDAVDAGFLMSYGTDHEALFRRTPAYVDKLLRGARPQDLPVEQPTTFELCVNLKTARALGLKLPQSILLQAQRVIE